MANSYYARSSNFTASTTARGSEVKAEYDLVVGGFDSVKSDITKVEGDISNLQAGNPPGWGASLDTRWVVNDTSNSTNIYTATLSPAPTGQNITQGYSIELLVNNNNIGGGVTLNVGSLEGAIPIVKVNGPAYQALDPDDMTTLERVKLIFLGTNWVMRQAGVSGVEVGTFTPFGGTVVPTGYLECYGQAISRVTYAELFAVISTTYGVGDGSTTFNLPDFRGRPLMGWDNIGGTAANVLLPLKYGKLAAGEPSGKAPAYGTWLVKT